MARLDETSGSLDEETAAAEAIAAQLNAAIGKRPNIYVKRPTLFQQGLSIVLGRQSVSEVERPDEELEGKEEEYKTTAETANTVTDSAPAKADATPKRATVTFAVQGNNGKRKRSNPRPDVYEIETSPVREVEEEKVLGEPSKRRRISRAKIPITIPKSSRPTSILPSSTLEQPGIVGTRNNSSNTDTRADRDRVSETDNRASGSHEILPSDEEGEDEGDTFLYMSASPVKVSQQRAGVRTNKENTPHQIVGRTGAGSQSSSVRSSYSDQREEVMAHSENPRPCEGIQELLEPTFFDVRVLRSIITTSKRVGHSFDRATKSYTLQKSVLRPYTAPGKRIKRRLDALNSEYAVLQKAQLSNHGAIADQSQQKILQYIGEVEIEAEQIVSTRLTDTSDGGDPSFKKSIFLMLTDVYFIVSPLGLMAIESSAAGHMFRTSSRTADLQQTLRLASVLVRLTEAALDHHCQPKASEYSDTRSCLISKPTRDLIFDLRNLNEALRSELKRRERAERQAQVKESNALARAVRRTNFELRQRQQQELTRKKSRLQNRIIAEELADPIWGHVLRSEIQRSERRAGQTGIRENDSYRDIEEHHGLGEGNEAEDIDGDLIIDPRRPQRVKLFDNHNRKPQSLPEPWTDQEQMEFIEFFRSEPEGGDARYGAIANILQRSMDDVFDYAKELQEAFDHEHSEGRLNDFRDRWTVDVWIERQRQD